MQDAILNQGQPAPIDVQVNTRDLNLTYSTAQDLARRIRQLPGVGQIYIPQDMNYPSVRMDIDRVHAGELGLSQKDVVDNVITALNSNIMIAPNYWVDYKTGNDYFLSVQYAEHGKPAIHNLVDLKQIPLRAPNLKNPTTLDSVVKLVNLQSPTEIDHYQIQRVVDVYVTPAGEDLAKLRSGILQTIADAKLPSNIRVTLRGMVNSMDRIFQKLWDRLRHFVHSSVSDSGRAIQVLDRSVFDHAGDPDGIRRRAHHLAADPHHDERDVADGRADADRHCGFQQHSDRRLRAQTGRAGHVGGRCGDHRLPRAPAADSDDFAGDHYRDDSHGDETGRGRRTVHPDGSRHHRRLDFIGASYDVHRSGRLLARLWEERTKCCPESITASYSSQFPRTICAQIGLAQTPPAQNLPKLTLQQAEAMAIQNHPQIQAAQNEVNYANQQIVENRSAYYPNVTGDVTGSQGNDLSRIGAGDITASRLFDRFGQGVVVRQLITDFGRTSNLVASSRLQAQATAQTSQATRYDVLLQVNRAYFDVLHAQGCGEGGGGDSQRAPVAERSGDRAWQEQLRSQLDVSFAEVNVSEAKLLLIRAQDAVQEALAELGRALGSDQPADYQLAEEPLPSRTARDGRSIGRAGSRQPPGTRGPPLFARCRLQIRGCGEGSLPAHGQRDRRGRIHPVHQHACHFPHPARIRRGGRQCQHPRVQWASVRGSPRGGGATRHGIRPDGCATSSSGSRATSAWPGPARTTLFSGSTSQRSFCDRRRWRWISRRGRYNLGLSSIVELTQAQLNLTQAEIENLNAKYDYQTQYPRSNTPLACCAEMLREVRR